MALLADESGVAEREAGDSASFFCGEAGRGMLLGAEFEVEAYFFVKVGGEAAAVDEAAKAAEKFSEQVHDGSRVRSGDLGQAG